MKYDLIIYDERSWQKDINRLSFKERERIEARIELLQDQPTGPNVDVKKLQNFDGADFRLRISDYRVLFTKDDEKKIIYLLRIRHRSKLYK